MIHNSIFCNNISLKLKLLSWCDSLGDFRLLSFTVHNRHISKYCNSIRVKRVHRTEVWRKQRRPELLTVEAVGGVHGELLTLFSFVIEILHYQKVKSNKNFHHKEEDNWKPLAGQDPEGHWSSIHSASVNTTKFQELRIQELINQKQY